LLSVLLLVTAFIVYGSLYPWQFHAATIPGNPLLILLSSWPLEINRYFVKDAIINVVLYIPFGAASYLWLSHRAPSLRVLVTLVLGILLSSSMEMIQLFEPLRFCSMVDVTTNFTGTAVGIVLAARFRSMIAFRPGTGVPLLLLACSMGAILFPFMPDLSVRHLNYKLLSFISPPFSAVTFFNVLVMWLAAARLMEAAIDRYVVPLLLLILPARLVVMSITLSWLDAVPAILAVMIWFAWPLRSKRRDALLAALSIAAIVLAGLAPFHFSGTSQGFSWIPFRALFTTDWQNGVVIFFRKSFIYGSTIWLLVAAGASLRRSTLAIAVLLGGLEAVQLWLPNHVSESTDPLHALLMGYGISRFSRGNPNPSQRVC
jgi:VanZ family protein